MNKTSSNTLSLEKLVAESDYFCSDSRQASNRSVFVALKGEKTDGHSFVEKVLSLGSWALIDNLEAVPANLRDSKKLFCVPETRMAHKTLAKLFRKKFSGKVIAIGGSSGKTTTKDLLFQLICKHFVSIKTEKSQNGELGIPKTLEQLRPETQLALIEIGIDAPGDMQRHVSLVEPNIAVLTSIGEEHLNLLKNIETVFREERILFDHTLALGGKCFGPKADTYLASLASKKNVFLTEPQPPPQFVSPLKHPHALQNLALALGVALEIGVPESELVESVKNLEASEGRGQWLQLEPRRWLIADHYNSNPSSLRAGLKFAKQESDQRQLSLKLILGDMLDLGEQTKAAHLALSEVINSLEPSHIALIGEHMCALEGSLKAKTFCFLNSAEAAKNLPEPFRSEGVILLKGSRGMKLELLLAKLKA